MVSPPSITPLKFGPTPQRYLCAAVHIEEEFDEHLAKAVGLGRQLGLTADELQERLGAISVNDNEGRK